MKIGFLDRKVLRRGLEKLRFHINYKLNHPYKPLYVNLVVANPCNFKCKQCDIWRYPPTEEGEMSLEERKKLIKRLKEWLGKFTLSVGGGEPFTKKDKILDIVRFCSSLGINCSTVTNGYFIDEILAKEIILSGFKNVIVSIDSLDPEFHDRLRGVKGALEKAKRGVESLVRFKKELNSDILITVHTILMEQNLDEIISLVKWCKEKDIVWAFQLLSGKFAFGREEYKSDWYKENEFFVRDLDKLKKVIEELIHLKKRGFSIGNSQYEIEFALKYYADPTISDNHKCATGFKNIIIDPYGNVKLCFLFPSVGNIREADVVYIWKNSQESKKQRLQIQKCMLPCKNLQCNRYDYSFLRIIKEMI